MSGPNSLTTTVLKWLAAVGAVMLLYNYVGRFVLPVDLWQPLLDQAQLATDHNMFNSGVVVHLVYALSAAAAAWFGAGTLGSLLHYGRSSNTYLVISVLCACAGIALSLHQKNAAIGGNIMPFFWWSFGLLWLATTAVHYNAWRKGASMVARDWGVYSVGLAFVPITALPQIPLWSLMPAMDIHEATLTAVTNSFAAHYVIAHFWLLEMVDSRATVSART